MKMARWSAIGRIHYELRERFLFEQPSSQFWSQGRHDNNEQVYISSKSDVNRS
jgi:hypothetical protein